MALLRELIIDLKGKNRAEKYAFRAIHVGTFALSQADPSMRGSGTAVMFTAATLGIIATFTETPTPSEEQEPLVRSEEARH